MEIKLNEVLIGRILGALVILVAIVSAIVGAATEGFDASMHRLATPLGLGSLILVVTELVRVVEERGKRTSDAASPADDDG